MAGSSSTGFCVHFSNKCVLKETFFVLRGPSVHQEREQESSGGVKGEFKGPPALGSEQGVEVSSGLPSHL